MPDWAAFVRSHLSLPQVRPDREAEIVEDLARQLDDAYREAIAGGASASEARAIAEDHIGNWAELAQQLAASPRNRLSAGQRWQDRADDRVLDTRGRRSTAGSLLQDVRYAWRGMVQGRTVTLVALLSLALGIGANTAIFTVINALLFRPLPIAHPEELVTISDPTASGTASGIEGGERSLFSYHEFEGFRDHADVLSSVVAFSSEPDLVRIATASGDEGRDAGVTMVSGTFFPALGIAPAAGTFFGAEVDAARMANPVAVVSDAFWRNRLQADPNGVGRTIRINQSTFRVAGILPAAFTGLVVGDAPDVYVPLTMQGAVIVSRDLLTQPSGNPRRVMFLHVVGRLKPGVSLSRANTALNATLHQGLDAEAALVTDPVRRQQLVEASVVVRSAQYGLSPLRGEYQEPLVVLMALVGLLLLLACANVANLLLARTTARRRELALRVALGASRARLLRQLLTEAVVLAGVGAVAGVAISRVGVAILLRLVSADSTPVPLDTHPDAMVLLFAVGVTLFTALLFGLAPALRATRLDLNTVLRGAAANVAGSGRGTGRWPLGKILAAVQIALSMLLLVTAGLFIRSLQNLGSVSLGYAPGQVVMFRIAPAAAGYTMASARPMYDEFLARLATIPGVRHASLSQNGLFYGADTSDEVSFPGHPMPPGVDADVRLDRIGAGYFQTIGIPIIAGHDVTGDDLAGPVPCWLNNTMAKRFFGADSPIGQRMVIHYSFGDGECDVHGVVGDARTGSMRGEIQPRAYLPFFPPVASASAVVELQVAGDRAALGPDIRALVREINPALPAPTFHTVADLIELSLARDRLTARLSTLFGGLALLLAAVGIYGVLSYSVTRRVNEIGVRMALGAARATILRLVLLEALVIAAIGAAVGLAGALGATRFIGAMLFGLGARDPITFAGGLMVMVLVTVVAAAVPAWRASRTDPMRALRTE